jgi:hypothetical protein
MSNSGPGTPHVELPDAAQLAAAEQLEAQGVTPTGFRPLVSLVCASALALLGAVGWAGISYATDYQIGLVAIGIGVLAGVGAARGGRSRPAQLIGAAMSAMGFFVGQLLLIVALVIHDPSILGASTEVEDNAPPTAAEVAPPDSSATPGTAPTAAPEEARAEPTADTEPVGLSMALAVLFFSVIVQTFTSFDAVFLAIAVWEGYRIPRATE